MDCVIFVANLAQHKRAVMIGVSVSILKLLKGFDESRKVLVGASLIRDLCSFRGLGVTLVGNNGPWAG